MKNKSIQAMSDYIFASRYARYDKDKKRRRTWQETVDVVRDMHLTKYEKEIVKFPELEDDIMWAFQQVADKRVLGSQRSLQYGGDPILNKNCRLYNCSASYCDRVRFFQETFWILLCGAGAGFSIQKHHVEKLPKIQKRTNQKCAYVVPDSIEGWSDALGILLSSYFIRKQPFPEYFGKKIEFDFSQIRPKGSPLSSGVGKAPGSEGLRKALERIELLLEQLVSGTNEPFKLKPIHVYDVIMHVSDAVLSGGVRRSSTICLFSPDDEEMLNAKTGDWLLTNPQRARSNNSVVLIRNKTSKEQFERIMQSVKEFGEPGFVWSDDTELLVNPCCEIGLIGYETFLDENGNIKRDESGKSIYGKSGWSFCVSGDTKLVTMTGLEYIKDVIGKKIAIWNGYKWCNVIPFETGKNKELYRVKFSDGSFLDCTENHKFLVKDRMMKNYIEVETKDLMRVSKYAIHVPPSNIIWNGYGINEEYAYEYGFVLGDGTCTLHKDKRIGENIYGRPRANIFENDFKLPLRGRITKESQNSNGTKYKHIIFDELNRTFCFKLKREIGLPKEVFTWNKKSLINFIAGWIDADGSKVNKGCRIYGKEEKLRDLQLILTKLGIKNSVNLMQKKGTKTNLCIRKNDIWYIQIPNCNKLLSYRIKFDKFVEGNEAKGKWQTIKNIEKIEGLHNTFCLEEPENHTCMFNNIITKQCNLSEINGGKIKAKEDFEIAAKAAAIIGTLQAGYTKFDYLGKVSENIVKRESLLGVSLTGMMENPDILFDANIQKEMAKLVLEENERIAAMINVSPCARATCVKPSGTAALVLGTSSGIHPHHARRYFRRVQSNKEEPILQWFKLHNSKAVEESVWSANGTDEVITFCIEVERNARTKNQIDALTLLKHVRSTQKNWVMEGIRPELCAAEWLKHNVSNTIHIRDNEWEDVGKYIYDNRNYFAGISLLSIDGDKDYPQAPNCKVYSMKDITNEYGNGSLLASGLIVDGLHCFNNLWKACDCALDIGEPLYTNQLKRIIKENPKLYEDSGLTSMTNPILMETWLLAKVPKIKEKREWVRRAKQFARRYFNNDIRKMCYCLKDVHNLKLWIDLNREFVDVDYTGLIEETDETKIQQTIACAGGKCDIHI